VHLQVSLQFLRQADLQKHLRQLVDPSHTCAQHIKTYSCVGSARVGSSHKQILVPWVLSTQGTWCLGYSAPKEPRSVHGAASPCCPTSALHTCHT
jgi:hypothetical protein